MSDLLKLGLNIRYYRKLRGLTQEELGKRMGYERSAIAKIETGKIDIPLSKLSQFAKVLDCHPGDLLDMDTSFSEQQLRLMAYTRRLSDKYLEKLEERAEELVELSNIPEPK